jgi:hypothetical protein
MTATSTKQPLGLKAWIPARLIVATLLCLGVGTAHGDDTDANSPKPLRAKYGVLHDQLSHNQFQRPLYLESSETPGGVSGEIYALVNYPFTTVGAALNSPSNWCEIMILHLNTKYCRAATDGQRDILNVSIGKKYDQPLDAAHAVVFAYRVATQTPNYLNVMLNADEGPLSTRNYHIMLEAIPLENGQTFIHLAYSYAYGLVGRVAMQAYLGTVGKDKVGFTLAGTQPNGEPLHIGGMRGVVERNTMRYYLAIEAFLGALSEPSQARFEKRLHNWFAAIEHYPRQLHEMERSEYLDMKRKEYQRQQGG